MTKEKSKPTDTKSTNEGVSKKIESKTKKENIQSTSLPDKTSGNKDAPKSTQSEPSNTKKETHTRGETQKPVTDGYRKNWNSIFEKR